jgi:mono/diheme cytochrome c family protein
MKIIGVIVAVLVAQAILLVIFVYAGIYNVSTLSPDPAIIKWIFSTTSDNSAKHYSKGIVVPSLTGPSIIDKGFRDYHEICTMCHGAPGVEKSDIGKGLYPKPPNLTDSAKMLEANRLFWVIRNGIKSTGMPGFGKTKSDREIWNIVGFIEKMKNMTPQEYEAMRNRSVMEK